MQSNLESRLIEQKYLELRKYPRLDIDLGTLIEFDLQDEDQQFSDKALVIDASLGGCGIITVIKDAKLLQVNSICYVRVPEQSPIIIKTKIIWVKETQNNVFRLGLEYFEEN